MDNDPEIKDALDEARTEYDTILCDSAENALLFALNQREDIGSAVRSAQYVLNNKGRRRGYTPPSVSQNQNSEGDRAVIDVILGGFQKLHAEPKEEQSSNPDGSQSNNEPRPAESDIVQ